MTEPQTPPESQPTEEPAEQVATEPLYGSEDVQSALSESGQRALASAYFAQFTRDTALMGLTKTQADEMITAIQNNQPWSPPQAPPPEGEPAESIEARETANAAVAAGEQPPAPVSELQTAPPEGGAA